jgi:hypothetical protein
MAQLVHIQGVGGWIDGKGRGDNKRISGGIAALLLYDPSIKIGLSAFPGTSDVVDPMRALWILASLFPFVFSYIFNANGYDHALYIRTSTIQKYTAPKSILSNNTRK